VSILAVKASVEFMGTYLLVHAIIFSVNFGKELAALAIGSTLMVCIYTWGHVSGGHFNPAVSTGLFISGRMWWGHWLMYMLSQIFGGLVSGLIAVAICENRAHDTFAEIRFDGDEGLWTECLWTFLLVTVVLNTAASRSPGYKDNSFFGLAIGFTVVCGAIAVGPFSGGAFNPAVATGLNIGRSQIDGVKFNLRGWILALLFEMIGGFLAGVLFRLTEQAEVQPKKFVPLSRGTQNNQVLVFGNYGYQWVSTDPMQRNGRSYQIKSAY